MSKAASKTTTTPPARDFLDLEEPICNARDAMLVLVDRLEAMLSSDRKIDGRLLITDEEIGATMFAAYQARALARKARDAYYAAT
jgi:hypothetical protein